MMAFHLTKDGRYALDASFFKHFFDYWSNS